jgi:ribonuclease Y
MGEDPRIINAIGSHHNDIEPTCVESVLVQIADAISAARPGARRETLDNYVKRLENLENIADSFTGVDKAFAIQAGRELRIIVNNETINDEQSRNLAKDIAKKIENDLRYPGRIKVTIIRETRVVEYAR